MAKAQLLECPGDPWRLLGVSGLLFPQLYRKGWVRTQRSFPAGTFSTLDADTNKLLHL